MGFEHEEERECNCCLEIKDSIVVIICGEVDAETLRNSLEALMEAKANQ